MKITKTQLRQIIREEIQKLDEATLSDDTFDAIIDYSETDKFEKDVALKSIFKITGNYPRNNKATEKRYEQFKKLVPQIKDGKVKKFLMKDIKNIDSGKFDKLFKNGRMFGNVSQTSDLFSLFSQAYTYNG